MEFYQELRAKLCFNKLIYKPSILKADFNKLTFSRYKIVSQGQRIKVFSSVGIPPRISLNKKIRYIQENFIRNLRLYLPVAIYVKDG